MTGEPASLSIQTYRLDPTKFHLLEKRQRVQKIVLFSCLFLFVVFLLGKDFLQDLRDSSPIALWQPTVLLLLLFAAILYTQKKGNKRLRNYWSSWELQIGRDFLSRKIQDFPDVEIHRDEITAIRESTAGIRILTNSRSRMIGISPTLENYQDARTRLMQWMPLQPEEKKFWMSPANITILVFPLVTILMGVLFVSSNRWVVLATGVPLLVVLTWSLWSTLKSPHVPANTKRAFLFVLLPIAAIAAKLLTALRILHP